MGDLRSGYLSKVEYIVTRIPSIGWGNFAYIAGHLVENNDGKYKIDGDGISTVTKLLQQLKSALKCNRCNYQYV